MILTIIILAYVLNVFLNRWLDYKIQQSGFVFFWFIPIFPTIALIILGFLDFFDEKKLQINNRFWNWFVGKHW
jgi:hypothetical protein